MAARGLSQSALAALIGISQVSIGRMLSYERPTKHVVDLAKALAVRPQWLAMGEGPMEAAGDEAGEGVAARLEAAIQTTRAIPVIGLAECGLKGWWREEPMAVAAACPADLADPDAFAVIASGRSMEPEGIRPGYLLICSPGARPRTGEVVYVERRGGEASVKVFLRRGGDWIDFKSYLDPDEKGVQTPYNDRIARAEIARLAPVVYIKRRL
jgi:phage repressor protein C with HTH and peptisase S24 domain